MQSRFLHNLCHCQVTWTSAKRCASALLRVWHAIWRHSFLILFVFPPPIGYSIDVSVNRTLGKQRLLPHPLRRVWAWMHRVSRLFSEQTPASAGATPLSPLLQSASALHKQDRYRGVHGLLSPVGASWMIPILL
jgi:hypothetical protein